MTKEQQAGNDRPYEKPRLITISLAADEVMGVGCKAVRGAPGGIGGTSCNIVPCTGLGS